MNKMRLLVSAFAAGFAMNVLADGPVVTAEIWPTNQIPLAIENPQPEGVRPFCDDIVRLADVSVPAVVVTPVPWATKPVPAVVICPGGGYGILAWNHEGVEVAQWLKSLGISGVILKYRVPDQRDAALADAQRAIRWVRAHAKELNIDPTRVGIMGFSAGANLTVRTATNHKKPIYAAIDDVDKMSCRPDFQLPIYPWDVRVRTKVEKNGWPSAWSNEYDQKTYPVDRDTPPAFIVQTLDDFCEPQTATTYDYVLKRAGVDSTLKLYQSGGHGYGLRQLGRPCDLWPYEATSWLARFAGTSGAGN